MARQRGGARGAAEGRETKRGRPRAHALSALAAPSPSAAAGPSGRGDRLPAGPRRSAALSEEAWPRGEGVRRRRQQKEAGPGAGEGAAGRYGDSRVRPGAASRRPASGLARGVGRRGGAHAEEPLL